MVTSSFPLYLPRFSNWCHSCASRATIFFLFFLFLKRYSFEMGAIASAQIKRWGLKRCLGVCSSRVYILYIYISHSSSLTQTVCLLYNLCERVFNLSLSSLSIKSLSISLYHFMYFACFLCPKYICEMQINRNKSFYPLINAKNRIPY